MLNKTIRSRQLTTVFKLTTTHRRVLSRIIIHCISYDHALYSYISHSTHKTEMVITCRTIPFPFEITTSISALTPQREHYICIKSSGLRFFYYGPKKKIEKHRFEFRLKFDITACIERDTFYLAPGLQFPANVKELSANLFK